MNETATAGKMISRKKRAAFAAAAVLAILLVCETALRLSGLFPDTKPFTEFAGKDGKAMVRYNLTKLQPPFSPEPEPGVYRVIVAGESTAAGFPYQPRSNFGLRLKALMEDAEPGLTVELINLGKVGINSTEVAEVVVAAREFHPSLIIVYSGQNEFIALQSKPPAWAAPALKIFSHLKTAQAIGGLVALAVGHGREKFMRGLEEEPQQALILRHPPVISAKAYAGVIDEYRKNVASFASPSGGPPVVVMAQASNLRGWPPATESFPESFSEQDRKNARETVDRAGKLIEEKNLDEAADVLEKEREQRPGYAVVSFELGRARSKLLERENENPPNPLKDPEAVRREALADFKRALEEEAHVVISHRAPHDINAILKITAAKKGMLFFDTEAVMDEATWLAPGFDVYDDHCHPNLFGQQIISESLFDFLRDNLPSFPAKENPGTWDEEGFQEVQNIDNEFLHKINLNLGIFLGLKMHFPDRSAAVREKLMKAADLKPQDPLPVIIGTLIACHYPPPRPEAIRLSNFQGQFATIPSMKFKPVHRALARYFTSMVALKEEVFMARLDQNPEIAPLSGLLKSGLFHEQSGSTVEPMRPLADYTVFLDLEDGATDVTELMNKGLANRKIDRSGLKPLEFIDLDKGKVLLPGPGASVISMLRGVTYSIDSDSFVSTGPIHIKPWEYSTLELVYQAPTATKKHILSFEWVIKDDYIRGVDLDLSVPKNPDSVVTIDLSQSPHWVMAPEILDISIRLLSISKGDRLFIQRMTLLP